jgi:hypothetical protein
MEVLEIDGVNIYNVGTKLQAADIGAKRITCFDTWRSNCVLINLCEPGVDATGQRALLSALRRDAVDKLTAREEHQRVEALEHMEASAGFSASTRVGSVKSRLQKKKRAKTNKVAYDDPATHTCLCCGDYDTDCEPAYPCELVESIGLWNNKDI